MCGRACWNLLKRARGASGREADAAPALERDTGRSMADPRITSVAVDVVRWPLKMKRRHGVGDIEESMPGAIVKISTNTGVVGWGEVVALVGLHRHG